MLNKVYFVIFVLVATACSKLHSATPAASAQPAAPAPVENQSVRTETVLTQMDAPRIKKMKIIIINPIALAEMSDSEQAIGKTEVRVQAGQRVVGGFKANGDEPICSFGAGRIRDPRFSNDVALGVSVIGAGDPSLNGSEAYLVTEADGLIDCLSSNRTYVYTIENLNKTLAGFIRLEN